MFLFRPFSPLGLGGENSALNGNRHNKCLERRDPSKLSYCCRPSGDVAVLALAVLTILCQLTDDMFHISIVRATVSNPWEDPRGLITHLWVGAAMELCTYKPCTFVYNPDAEHRGNQSLDAVAYPGYTTEVLPSAKCMDGTSWLLSISTARRDREGKTLVRSMAYPIIPISFANTSRVHH
jgi:hypothetical protein